MPSKRNKDNFTWQKAEALLGLIKAIWDGNIPESTHEAPASERFLSSGKIIELLGDEYQRLPNRAMREALVDVGLTCTTVAFALISLSFTNTFRKCPTKIMSTHVPCPKAISLATKKLLLTQR